jgi:hypothetical protein
MNPKLVRAGATACGLAALLALGACSEGLDRGGETTAERTTSQEMGSAGGQAAVAPPSDDAAARAAAQRTGAIELKQGEGT